MLPTDVPVEHALPPHDLLCALVGLAPSSSPAQLAAVLRKRLALFLDFDGTLSELAPRPELAVLVCDGSVPPPPPVYFPLSFFSSSPPR